MEYLGTISYSLAAIAFAAFSILVATHSRRSSEILFLALAIVASIAWAAASAYYANKIYIGSVTLEALELIRDITWLLFLQILLLNGSKNSKAYPLLKKLVKVTYVFYGSLIVLVAYYATDPVVMISEAGYQYRAISHLVLAAFGIFLIEQLLRHISPDHRWAVKYFCVGLGGIFTYEFYLYADTLLLQNIDPEIWIARGFVNALMVPLLAISAIRTPQFSLKFFVSHRIVFHTTALLAGGLYLLAMGLGGYYIRLYGGAWGGMLQVVFLFGALIILFILLFSGSIRASLRVFLGKHFFRYRYDYRDEWLRITETLSGQQESSELYHNALRAIADIVESPAGQLWMRRDSGLAEHDKFDVAANWNIKDAVKIYPVPVQDLLITYLEQTQWIIDVDEYRSNPGSYKGLELAEQFLKFPEIWLIVPLMHQKQLLGFVVLTHARTKYSMNWEVRDILRTAGRQAAGYLALLEVNIKLASARQFEAFNRLSAFVVHDIKNVVAQLALVERNARIHKDNPDFIDDAMTTIANATQKMNRLLAQLRSPQTVSKLVSNVNLANVLEQVLRHRAAGMPVPSLECVETNIEVLADRDRLAAVIEHLVQNAQEATEIDGFVRLRLYTQGSHANIEIKDSGCGMNEDFVKKKLFKPFVTTKGNAGMGIGVFEAREVVRSLGGTIDVESQPGKGTMFLLKIPLKNNDGIEVPEN